MCQSKYYQIRNPNMKDSRCGPMTNTQTWLHRHTLTQSSSCVSPGSGYRTTS